MRMEKLMKEKELVDVMCQTIPGEGELGALNKKLDKFVTAPVDKGSGELAICVRRSGGTE